MISESTRFLAQPSVSRYTRLGELAVDILAVSNARDPDNLIFVVNVINDTVLACANTPSVGAAHQLEAAGRPRIRGEPSESSSRSPEVLAGQAQQVLFRGFFDDHSIRHRPSCSARKSSSGRNFNGLCRISPKSANSSGSPSRSSIFLYCLMSMTTDVGLPSS